MKGPHNPATRFWPGCRIVGSHTRWELTTWVNLNWIRLIKSKAPYHQECVEVLSYPNVNWPHSVHSHTRITETVSLPQNAMQAWPIPSCGVRPSVCPSVTFVNSVEMSKHILKLSSRERRMLTASDFHQSRLQTNRVTCRKSDWQAGPPNWCSYYSDYVYTRVAAVYIVLVLSQTLADRERLRQLSLKWFMGWSVSGAVFYYVIITARCRRSVHCLLAPISLSQTSSSDAHLETWLRDYASSLWGLWGGDVDNFCVLIIKNCCPSYWKQKK